MQVLTSFPNVPFLHHQLSLIETKSTFLKKYLPRKFKLFICHENKMLNEHFF